MVKPSITVAIARFEDIVGRGLRSLVDDDEQLELVAEDIPRDEIPAVLRVLRPLVTILNFASLTNAAELRELHRAFPGTRLMVLADRPTAGECRQMVSFGATACLSKATQARDVLHAIHLASRGMHVLPPAVIDEYEPPGPELLTPRESEVLELLQAGQSNAEIAQALHVSIETVRTHARRVYRKLGVRTRRELRARQ